MPKLPSISVKISLLCLCIAFLATAGAQSVTPVSGTISYKISDDSLRRAIIGAVSDKIRKSHYAPAQNPQVYSGKVFDAFLRNLDPARYIFLKADIDQLLKHKNAITGQLSVSSTAFFDETFAIYQRRIGEVKKLAESILGNPFSFKEAGSFQRNRADSSFPLTAAAREKLWKGTIKNAVLRYYLEMENGVPPKKTGADTALVRKATNKVAAWYKRYFKKQLSERSIDDLFSIYMNSITMEVDPHSTYVYPRKQDMLGSMLNSKYYGIGTELAQVDLDVVIKAISPDGTAFKTGLLKENDRILSISDNNGKLVSTEELEVNDVVALIRGEKGSAVTMMVAQPGAKERKVTIPRGEITSTSNNARSAVVEQNGKKIGIVYLPIFYMNPNPPQPGGSAFDFYNEVLKLKNMAVDGIIVDLRGNGGGSLQEVVAMGSCFMPQVTMAFTRSRDSLFNYPSPAVDKPLYDGPLAVLIDESSASASEIFAAAIQDHHRGIVIGTASSFGKGTAQGPINMGKLGDASKGTADISYGSMRLTIQKFYRASGRTTQQVGVIPDVVLTDKVNPDAILEKDYPAVMAADTLNLPGYAKDFSNSMHTVAIDKARQRVKSNAALQQMNTLTQQVKLLKKAPSKLDLAGFRAQSKAIAEAEKALQNARSLNNDSLVLKKSADPSINPALIKSDPKVEAQYQSWLAKLSKDLFLSEAVLLIQDMISPAKN